MAGSSHAQSVGLRADIPFDFVVGNTIMHAGTYTIQPMRAGESPIQLQSLDGKDSMWLAVCTCASDRAQHESQFVFQAPMANIFFGRSGRRVMTKAES
jgi:hypothetical protein